jgi:phage tail protein X
LCDRGKILKIDNWKYIKLYNPRALIAGGGAPETELSLRLSEHAQSVTGVDAYCFKAYADALEIIPLTLAENAGLNSIATVTELRNRHAQGEITAGINVRKVCIWSFFVAQLLIFPIRVPSPTFWKKRLCSLSWSQQAPLLWPLRQCAVF